MREHQDFIRKLIGVPKFSIASPKQVHWLCYEILKLPAIRKKGAKSLTADKDAVAEWLRTCEPLYRPILQSIVDYRSLQVFRGTFALASIDTDGRFRCSINVAGPSTFRLSTSEDAFGFGTNMQNLPKGDED
jgi:DNA polymerase I-like protein with 3'-5' exonuclease and polymerase domains